MSYNNVRSKFKIKKKVHKTLIEFPECKGFKGEKNEEKNHQNLKKPRYLN